MEKRLKLRLYRIFQASFFSCRSKKNSDIIMDKPISSHSQFPPRNIRKNFPIISSSTHPQNLPRRKISQKFSPFLAPPASPISPLKPAPLSHLRDCLSREKNKTKTKPKRKISNSGNTKRKFNTTPPEDFGGSWWYGGDDDETEDETETLFSSRSLTSDSSVSRRRLRAERRITRRRSERRGAVSLDGKFRDSFFAVVKNSRDPYKDFKASMAEMIVEKEIFEAKELEQLLQCFISLNSRHYHTLIFQAYSEIKEALFFF